MTRCVVFCGANCMILDMNSVVIQRQWSERRGQRQMALPVRERERDRWQHTLVNTKRWALFIVKPFFLFLQVGGAVCAPGIKGL